MSQADVVVIGGGLAGLQAGIYTAKAGEETIVFDGGDSWVAKTGDVQNLLGFETVSGSHLLERGREQFVAFGGEYVTETVTRVERVGDEFLVTTDADDYASEYVIVATAGSYEYLAPLELTFEDGVDGQYYVERHVSTDAANRAADGIYVAGLANTWEFQSAVAIGDGAKAAVNLLREKRGEPYMDHDV